MTDPKKTKEMTPFLTNSPIPFAIFPFFCVRTVTLRLWYFFGKS